MPLKRMLVGLLMGLMVTVSVRGAERFEIDSAHAFVYFTIAHFSGKARGSFRDVAGTIHYDESDISKSSVEVVIKTASVNTNNERRDTHLRSADFFEAEKYPDMTFKSRRISRQGKGFLAVGDLTIKGVTKEVTMPFNLTGPIKDPLPTGVRRLMVGASLTIDRREFGITWSRLTDTNDLFVGNEVVIDINVEAIVPKPRQAGD